MIYSQAVPIAGKSRYAKMRISMQKEKDYFFKRILMMKNVCAIFVTKTVKLTIESYNSRDAENYLLTSMFWMGNSNFSTVRKLTSPALYVQKKSPPVI